MRAWILILALVLLAGTTPASWAQDEAEYAQREAESGGLEDFQGGDLLRYGPAGAELIITLAILVVYGIGYAIYAFGCWVTDAKPKSRVVRDAGGSDRPKDHSELER